MVIGQQQGGEQLGGHVMARPLGHPPGHHRAVGDPQGSEAGLGLEDEVAATFGACPSSAELFGELGRVERPGRSVAGIGEGAGHVGHLLEQCSDPRWFPGGSSAGRGAKREQDLALDGGRDYGLDDRAIGGGGRCAELASSAQVGEQPGRRDRTGRG